MGHPCYWRDCRNVLGLMLSKLGWQNQERNTIFCISELYMTETQSWGKGMRGMPEGGKNSVCPHVSLIWILATCSCYVQEYMQGIDRTYPPHPCGTTLKMVLGNLIQVRNLLVGTQMWTATCRCFSEWVWVVSRYNKIRALTQAGLLSHPGIPSHGYHGNTRQAENGTSSFSPKRTLEAQFLHSLNLTHRP